MTDYPGEYITFTPKFAHSNIIAMVGNQFVAIDSASGGYPFLVDDLKTAATWTSVEKAADYLITVKDYANCGVAVIIEITQIQGEGKAWSVSEIITRNNAYEKELADLKRKYNKK